MCIHIPRTVFFAMIKLYVANLIVMHTLYVTLIQHIGLSPSLGFMYFRVPDS